jgi:signal transduction histidine kinase
LVTSLLGSSLDAIRDAEVTRGSVRLRVSPEEGCVLLEIQHNGRPMRSDLRPDLLEARFGERARLFDSDLLAVRQRARELGGDLLVDNDDDGTTLRLILPGVEQAESLAPLPDGWDEDIRRRSRAS